MSNSDYLFYKSLLKGNYVKGANTLEGIMENQAQATELALNDAAMTVIFEPMTYGGRWWLSNVFFNGLFSVGAGLRTYVRTKEPGFDPTNMLGALNTILNIAMSTAAMQAIDTSEWARKAIANSYVALTTIVAETTAMSVIAASSSWMKIMVSTQLFMDHVVKSQTALNSIKTSQVAMDQVVASTAFMNTIGASQTAMFAVGSTKLAADTLAASSKAMSIIRDNEEFRKAMASSPVAMASIAASANAMYIIAPSVTFMTTISQYGVAINAIASTQNAINVIDMNMSVGGPIICTTPNFITAIVNSSIAMNVFSNNVSFMDYTKVVADARTRMIGSSVARTYIFERETPVNVILNDDNYAVTLAADATATAAMATSTFMGPRFVTRMESQITDWEALPPDRAPTTDPPDPGYTRPPFETYAILLNRFVYNKTAYLNVMMETQTSTLIISANNRTWAYLIGDPANRIRDIANIGICANLLVSYQHSLQQLENNSSYFTNTTYMNALLDALKSQIYPRTAMWNSYKANIWNAITANRAAMDRIVNDENGRLFLKSMFDMWDSQVNGAVATPITRMTGQTNSVAALLNSPLIKRITDITFPDTAINASTAYRLSDKLPGRNYWIATIRSNCSAGSTQTYTLRTLSSAAMTGTVTLTAITVSQCRNTDSAQAQSVRNAEIFAPAAINPAGTLLELKVIDLN